ncbi:MAG: hypothetical protein PHD85_04600 [Bacilli bacterium]|nr:hypothetical protein [Bacilli bacterium]
MNNIDRILDDFEEYCTNEIVSGKARSYKLAIIYLCDYLKITQFDNEFIAKIEYTANELKDYNSSTYKEVLSFLTKRRQSSYLLKGWINAGVNQFLRFMN